MAPLWKNLYLSCCISLFLSFDVLTLFTSVTYNAPHKVLLHGIQDAEVLLYTDVEYTDYNKGKSNTCLVNEFIIIENFGSNKNSKYSLILCAPHFLPFL